MFPKCLRRMLSLFISTCSFVPFFSGSSRLATRPHSFPSEKNNEIERAFFVCVQRTITEREVRLRKVRECLWNWTKSMMVGNLKINCSFSSHFSSVSLFVCVCVNKSFQIVYTYVRACGCLSASKLWGKLWHWNIGRIKARFWKKTDERL